MDYTRIKTDRQFKSTTGHSKTEFEILYKKFEELYIKENGQNYEDYVAENVTEPPKLNSLSECLYFVLFQLKNDMTYDSLGAVFNMNGSTAHNNFKKYLKLLEEVLKKKVYPKRKYENVEEFESDLKEEEVIIFDGTENRIDRPQNNDNQKDMYSGKKKCHTDIAMVLSNKARWIYYVSEIYCGKTNDFGLFKTEFEPGLGWFKNFTVLLDLGFVGFSSLYQSKEVLIGYKKPRKSKNNPDPPDLTEEQKEWNREVSKQRIYVEHAIGGMKRYRVLINRSRLKCYNIKNTILGVCAALWNFKLSCN